MPAIEYIVERRFIENECLEGTHPHTSEGLKEVEFNTTEAIAIDFVREPFVAVIRDEEDTETAGTREAIGISWITARSFAQLRPTVNRMGGGIKELDELIGGGIGAQSITEFFGEFITAKSQLFNQPCINAQPPPERRGLDAVALYIGMENSFSVREIVSMAKHVGLEPEKVCERVIYAEARTSDRQIPLLEAVVGIIKENNIRLIVIDPLREMLPESKQELNKHLHSMARLARGFNAAVVTNQVMSRPCEYYGQSPLYTVGGRVVGHTSHTRTRLRRKWRSDIRIARLVSSQHLPDGEALFELTANGVEDVNSGSEIK